VAGSRAVNYHNLIVGLAEFPATHCGAQPTEANIKRENAFGVCGVGAQQMRRLQASIPEMREDDEFSYG
jgi:hypothetical protein